MLPSSNGVASGAKKRKQSSLPSSFISSATGHSAGSSSSSSSSSSVSSFSSSSSAHRPATNGKRKIKVKNGTTATTTKVTKSYGGVLEPPASTKKPRLEKKKKKKQQQQKKVASSSSSSPTSILEAEVVGEDGPEDRVEEEQCMLCGCLAGERSQTILACWHLFHRKCIKDWLVKFAACPLCFAAKFRSSFVPRNPIHCPVSGCSEKMRIGDWRDHMKRAHCLIKCGTCKEVYMKQVLAIHKMEDCGRTLVVCPADGCHSEVVVKVANAAYGDASVLILDHACSNLYYCNFCSARFVEQEGLQLHALDCENPGTGTTRPRRAAAERCEQKVGDIHRLEESDKSFAGMGHLMGQKYTEDAVLAMRRREQMKM